ncbi:MAG: N-acetylmuramoyl-L-alanine amidase [Deltaproteobacteria bacterium]|nr:N-acetylmuramoyl-L-alanine amidase [Deltaproteobacteria bacterium]
MKMAKKLFFTILTISIILFLTRLAYANNSRENFIVAIDIGHTKNSGGALSAHGIYEYYYNQKVALLLLPELIKNGFKNSFIINEDGSDISLIGRTTEARERKADLLISIHHDSVQPCTLSTWRYQGEYLYYCDLFRGFSIFVSDNNVNSKRSLLFAKIAGMELLNRKLSPTLHHADPIVGENRILLDKEKGIYEYNKLVVLKTATMPAVLLECGIIKNRDEENSINSDYRNKVVKAIVFAIIRYHNSLSTGSFSRPNLATESGD